MTQKERLVELIIQSVDGCARHWAEIIADYLLDNGVIVMCCEDYSGAKFLGYDLEALACVAYSLEHNGITAEQLDQWKLDFEFALNACWNARCEYIRKSVNEWECRLTPDFGFWKDDWESKHKFEPRKVKTIEEDE